MAGHSQFKNIMHRKGAQDAKRAKVFTKIIRELTVAARDGADPMINARLRAAIIMARGANMPRDTMERAIKRGAGGEDMANYQEVRYEGYGPGGVALIVEALTDNRNRTAAEVRSAFNKFGGNLGESNSVSFSFDRLGLIRYPVTVAAFDAMFEAAVEVGADNVDASGDESDAHTHEYEITCAMDIFAEVRDALIQRFGDPVSAQLTWVPQTRVTVSDDQAETLMKLIDTLEDNDDVQTVAGNYDVSAAFAEKMPEGA
jgi:YebC/PmpR family DNA-binding regulatory protein